MPNQDETPPPAKPAGFRGAGLSRLPGELEGEIRALDQSAAVELFNRLTTGRRLIGVSDNAQIAQRLEKLNPDAIRKELEMLKRSEVKTAKTAQLVAAYNELTGKAIKKFASREAGEKQVLKLLPKEEAAAKASGRAPKTTMVAAKAQGTSKLQEASERAGVYNHLKEKHGYKAVPIEQLSEELEKDVRGFLGKLAEKGWVTLS